MGGRRRSGSCLPKLAPSGCSLSETTTVAENRLYLSPSRGPDQTTLSFNTYALTVPFSTIRLTSIQFPETSEVIAVLIVVIDLTPSNPANVWCLTTTAILFPTREASRCSKATALGFDAIKRDKEIGRATV